MIVGLIVLDFTHEYVYKIEHHEFTKDVVVLQDCINTHDDVHLQR